MQLMLINDQHNFYIHIPVDLYKCSASTSAVISIYICIYCIYIVAEGQPQLIFYVIRFAQLVLPSIFGYFLLLLLLLRFTITIEAILNATLSFISHLSLKWASNQLNFKLKIINYC